MNTELKQLPFTYTESHPNFRNEIITSVMVSLPISEGDTIKSDDKRLIGATALWDTGASNCVITPDLVKKLGISPISVANCNHAGGESVVNVYMINVYLPNHIALPNVRVSECADQAGRFGMIIGMDVIASGDFAISSASGIPTMSFCMPSMHRIDFNVTRQMLLSEKVRK
ncbi:MAG: retropepsin-like domain-containing protein [Oscillibacter sp.]|nr:retropepsin-like domain-containing protein [Oscillibacter sp.]